ncbi:isocitrate dehydrogenase (NADP(+)) [Kosmotoga olearia]|uniref:Isocitrate dehydrogenase [NADP] n=1 Tax=Kosmotoga olearia (strain ATCC BAA-1733 / DSM 21960 / TBF 19.5.1) TaxID=521045 RepID=C5CJ08_KOSOT|nr:isocitrate dehydrogenase (NADP(+)) [Kosmotoga olearia]ACR79924.1 Isocitrate dehydrogenase (NADP(+)) [Kosmotoga olearia TBF 19.5.1]
MEGQKIKVENNSILVPNNPIIPYIAGDGIGPEIMRAAMLVWNSAISRVYAGKRKVVWKEIYAGEKAIEIFGDPLPEETIEAIKSHVVSIKSPLTTPVGRGYRSLNVKLRQVLDLYACIRPVKWIKGVPAPVKHPELLDVVIFRENTEDVYAGIEWKKGSQEAKKVIDFLRDTFNLEIRGDSGLGLKPISEFATKRITRKAIQYALENGRKSVTIVHKGNIMKYTEGAFVEWAYEVALNEFEGKVVSERELNEPVSEKLIVKDRIADNMFQQILLEPSEYDIMLLPNLNGDYLSDAVAAQVGGIGLVPGANIGDFVALFEPTHGTAPQLAGKEIANPTSLILSGAMMFDYIGWKEVGSIIRKAVEKTIMDGKMTIDLARKKGVEPLKTTEFAEEIIKNIEE